MKKLFFLCFILLASCDQPISDKSDNSKDLITAAATNKKTVTKRWYTQSQLEQGNKVYQQHCVGCHNKDATGTVTWKTTQMNGVYPPPPLNGTAHAWHHDMSTLISTIENGGIPLGGVMPSFSQKLSAPEILAVIAYFQSYWSDEIYVSWLEIGGLE